MAHIQPSPQGYDFPTRPSSFKTKESTMSVNLLRGEMAPAQSPGARLSKTKKWSLLFLFSVAQYLDIASRASALVFIDDISKDLGIEYETSTWILNSYGVTFGSFLLLWGRVSDLYDSKKVFSFAFLWCGIWSIVISFMTDQYSFYIFRALYGISAAATIPSAFRLILAVFDPSEVQAALALFGMSGALANATGLIIGGAFGEIEASGQMAGWRWFFRAIAAISIPFALLSHILMPSTRGPLHDVAHKWRHLDIVGSTLILAALLLLNVGLTLGASRGWSSASFIVPFVAAWPLALGFFWWEHRREDDFAVLPKSIWKISNMKLMAGCGVCLFAGVALPLVERYQIVFGESPITAAIRMLPQGLSMCIVAIIAAPFIRKVIRMRLPIGIALLVAAASFIPMIYGDGEIGSKYWKFYVPSLIFGSMGIAIAFLGINITIMTSVQPTMAGVAGALWQVSLQTGVVVAYSIQAGLMTVHPGSISNWANPSTSFWFMFAWGTTCGILVLVLYQKRTIVGQEVEKENEGYVMETKGSSNA